MYRYNRMTRFFCRKLKMWLTLKGCRARWWMANESKSLGLDTSLSPCIGCRSGEMLYKRLEEQDKEIKSREVLFRKFV